jgi:hypothetical protein
VDHIFSEIRAAVSSGAWVLALFGVLAIPDICSALNSPDGRTKGKKYQAWFTHNLGAKYPSLDVSATPER